MRKASTGYRGGRDSRLRVFYRISDGGYKKNRVPFATKEACLNNFLSVFRLPAEDILVIADNVGDETWRMVNRLHSNVVRTEFGSGAASWRYAALELALTKCADQDPVYFVEDDYLHLNGSPAVLMEGLSLADYVSLYDHPDKYIDASNKDPNPFVAFGGELTRVLRTPSSHWKVTNSTTMTFATTVTILRQDSSLWDKFTAGSHPLDFQAFLALRQKGRSLIVPIPGHSTHCEEEGLTPGIDWQKVAQAPAQNG